MTEADYLRRAFYAFFHEYCGEVTLKEFFPRKTGFVANVVIRFTGLKDLSQETLNAHGYLA
jgi:hypothetical protein